MQYLEDIKQNQQDELDSWQFNHMNRIKHQSWERSAHRLLRRRRKEMRKLEREVHKKLRK
jgi:Ser/Thr protein kinase RdoA (MazF antagonist)